MTDEIKAEIAEIIRKMLYPSPFMRWMEGLEGVERTGRIRRSKNSVLRYGLQRYVQQLLPAVVLEYDGKIHVDPMDDEVIITGSHALNPETNWSVTVGYPYWLRDFLEEDENFELLLPECREELQEVLQRIYEWCYGHPPYDLLVKPA